MATKTHRGKTYQYVVKRRGLLPKPIYLTFDDEAEGDAYVAHLERLLDAGIVPEEFKTGVKVFGTIMDVIDVYLERDIPRSDMKLLMSLREQIGMKRLESVTYLWAEEWIQSMKIRQLSPSTIRHYVGALARMLDWVVVRADTMLVQNPLRQLPKRYASGHKDEVERDRRLSDDEEREVKRILDGGKPIKHERPFTLNHAKALRLLFTLAIETGMRMREIFTLTADQVDFGEKTIFLDKTKNGHKRQVPLSTVAIAELKAYGVQGNELLFPWWNGDQASLDSVTALLSAQFSRIFNAANCAEFTFHGLRHEATCRMYLRTRMTDLQIAKALGWRSLKTALRYANLRGSDLADLMW